VLFANSDAPVVSPQLLPAVVGSLVFTLVGVILILLLLPVLWRVMDRLTPGNLGEQLVPGGHVTQPNRALAHVVANMTGALILGVAIIIAAAIH
jgi:hypothetical protein